ncbi:hypothetical protein [Krasilnikovia sp. MM14-A1259]|uniref:hypothetical protein n=1 Tax=Krasilnikovia sp. MM14-A1259 TaxID=3373539 RepID=UPI0037F830D6
MDTSAANHETASRSPARTLLFSVLTGLASLAVLLQGVWAGIFLEHDGRRDDAGGWIDVHARGADVALVLAIAATIVAVWRLRSRKDLWIGSLVLVVLLAFESYLGGLIRDDGKDALTAVHIPLAMAIMAVSVWLPLRARIRR